METALIIASLNAAATLVDGLTKLAAAKLQAAQGQERDEIRKALAAEMDRAWQVNNMLARTLAAKAEQ